MARFFFHFHDGTDQPDLTGTELASSRAARNAAVAVVSIVVFLAIYIVANVAAGIFLVKSKRLSLVE